MPLLSHSLTAAEFAQIAFSGDTRVLEPNTKAPLLSLYVKASFLRIVGALVPIARADIPHKTEVGGVLLNIDSVASLNAALGTLRSNLAAHAPGVSAELALIQPMQPGLAEVLLGYRIDPDAGPLIMLAAGGIWTDLLRDRSIRLAPVSVVTAQEMIGEVRALKILTGLRGQSRGDLAALAEAISALSQLAVQPEHGVLEAEVNPLMIMGEGQGVLAVDALILKR